jgi:effector-binding domain-containing protein
MLTTRIKRIKAKPFTFLYGEVETEFAGIPKNGGRIMDKLMPFMQKHKIGFAGPCVWVYKNLGKGKVRLRAGFPVSKESVAKGVPGKTFSVREEPAWECYATEYAGAMDRITQAWDEFHGKVKKKGMKPGGNFREVYLKWIDFASPENVTELQVQVK